MNKEYIACLEHIIDLEKTRMAQEDLVEAMKDKANRLGLRRQIKEPVLEIAVLERVDYSCYSTLLPVVFGILALFLYVEFSSTKDVSLFWFSAFPFIFFLGIMLCLIIGVRIDKANGKKEAQRRYNTKMAENQLTFEKDQQKYNAAVAADEQRAKNELIVKDNILQSVEDLKAQIRKTEDTLKTYYDAAGIYDSNAYRNIVAVCYYHEYLASGICTELGGATGAYITYKNEMYSRMNIERLDTIINYLDQLHQDNQMLNESLQYVASCVNDVSRRMDTVITQQKTVTDRLDAHSRQVSGQLEEVTVQLDDIWRQGALSLYMQSCEEQNLNYLAWMEFNKAHLK